jgi:endonuclease/exonuclease/phosphatase family metal-dependent hydrolase
MIEVGAGPARAACRAPITPAGAFAADRIAWTAPVLERDRDKLEAWCSTTGPPVIAPQPLAPASPAPGLSDGSNQTGQPGEIVVVTWNLHGGAADLAGLVGQLRSGALTDGEPVSRFVLLVQEAYRAGAVVPPAMTGGVRAPRAVGHGANGRTRVDIVSLAQSLGLALYYVPSMRNGALAGANEDRGNAVLSTEPLSGFAAIELPFERQRRVAIAATVSASASKGSAWTVRVASVHLESRASARHLWILASGARVRQARGLLDALRPLDSLVVGGDLNSWFGYSDPTYRTLAAALPDAAPGDRRKTFGRLFRLDHLFAQPPDGWTVTTRRLDDRLGSDHYPLLARVRPSPSRSTPTVSQPPVAFRK